MCIYSGRFSFFSCGHWSKRVEIDGHLSFSLLGFDLYIFDQLLCILKINDGNRRRYDRSTWTKVEEGIDVSCRRNGQQIESAAGVLKCIPLLISGVLGITSLNANKAVNHYTWLSLLLDPRGVVLPCWSVRWAICEDKKFFHLRKDELKRSVKERKRELNFYGNIISSPHSKGEASKGVLLGKT